ncbi:hypothetical protein [Chitinibacter tainanensis]|uniref:hypothetical protein n=1 Tax=Chitinibacter tainanensis TaxID=230667 RepID=UPI0004903DA4|nr:hypothetical protein [Chitinibacter tainanensis]
MSLILSDTANARLMRLQPASRTFSLLRDMYVERGTIDDWHQLHALHYKTESNSMFGAHYWRCVLAGKTIGVVVFTRPRLLDKNRHRVLPGIKPGADSTLLNTMRGKVINREFALAARVVNDTQFRGVGLAYRMLNLSMRLEGLRLYEISSSMSKVNPFAERAGFRFAKPEPSTKYEIGLKFLRGLFESDPVDHEAIMNELNAMPEVMRQSVLRRMKQWYYKESAKEKTGGNLKNGTSRVEAMEAAHLLKEMQQLIFGAPAWGFYFNPDVGLVLPDRLPLTAFDRQGVHEPLNLEGLA